MLSFHKFNSPTSAKSLEERKCLIVLHDQILPAHAYFWYLIMFDCQKCGFNVDNHRAETAISVFRD